MWEIVTLGATPYPGMSGSEVLKKVKEGKRLEKPEHCNSKYPKFYNLSVLGMSRGRRYSRK